MSLKSSSLTDDFSDQQCKDAEDRVSQVPEWFLDLFKTSHMKQTCRLTNCGGQVEMTSDGDNLFQGTCERCGEHHSSTVTEGKLR